MTTKIKKQVLKKETEELCKSIRENTSLKEPAKSKKKLVAIKKQNRIDDSNNPVKGREKRSDAMKNKIRRDKDGKILPGSGSNGGGRPKGTFAGRKASELRQSIARVELERLKPKNKRKVFTKWLDHQVNKSYDDTSLAISLLNKLHPTLKSVEQVNIDGSFMDEETLKNLQKEYSERFNS